MPLMLENLDVLDQSVRRDILKDINSSENISRKREAQRAFDIYRGRQDRYILERLQQEFKLKTVQEMRKILSINMSERIIDELSSIYKNPPERAYTDASPQEEEQMENQNEISKKNSKMKMANRYYNLNNFCDVLVIPKENEIMIKPLTPMGYDIIEDVNNPEKAYGIIFSTFDDSRYASYRNEGNIDENRQDYYEQNFSDQKIADDDDRRKTLERHIWWTSEWHFTTDGHGALKSEVIPNPIERLPITNISREKDNQYFPKRGAGITEFAIDFSMALSDVANNIKMQGYAQAVITSTKQPTNLAVGPNKVIWLEQDPNAPVQPSFQFVSPNPDIAESLNWLETLLRLFMTSRNIDPKTISGKLEGQTFTSGVDRLLAMIDRFEASKDDLDLFRCAEEDIFELERLWTNEMQGVNDETRLVDDLNIAQISEDVSMTVKFTGPEAVKTEAEELDIVERRMENGTMSIVGAIERLDEVDKEKAKEMLEEIRQEEMENGQIDQGTDPDIDGEESEIEDEPEGDIRDRSNGEDDPEAGDGGSAPGEDR